MNWSIWVGLILLLAIGLWLCYHKAMAAIRSECVGAWWAGRVTEAIRHLQEGDDDIVLCGLKAERVDSIEWACKSAGLTIRVEDQLVTPWRKSPGRVKLTICVPPKGDQWWADHPYGSLKSDCSVPAENT